MQVLTCFYPSEKIKCVCVCVRGWGVGYSPMNEFQISFYLN